MTKGLFLTLGSLLPALIVASAEAQTPITWADFTRTAVVCECPIVPQTCEQWYVDTDGNWSIEYYDCSYEDCSRRQCREVRVPLPDGDLINVTVTHGAFSDDTIGYELTVSNGLTFWKEIAIDNSINDHWRVWSYVPWLTPESNRRRFCNWPDAETPNCSVITDWSWALDGATITFTKGKFLGVATEVYVLGNLQERLRPGDKITFEWIVD